jgi:hypothetical protein
MKNLRDILSASCWLIIAIFVCFEAGRTGLGSFHDPGPGFLPFLAALVLGMLALTVIANTLVRTRGTLKVAALWKGRNWGKVLIVIILLVAYSLLLTVLGYIVTTFVLMIFMFGLLGRPKLWIQSVSALVTSVVTYLIFAVWLQVQLPKGVFGF